MNHRADAIIRKARSTLTDSVSAKPVLQRQAVNNTGPEIAPPIVHEVLRSPGRPLDGATRGFMESRFNHDFSGVRVHTDEQATESVRAVNALAYTVGNHVAFGAGQYAPGTRAGRHLIAHELAHVRQQGARDVPPAGRLPVDSVHSPAERQADALGRFGRAAVASVAPSVQRTPVFGDGCNSEYRRCEVIEPLRAADQLASAAVNALTPLADSSVTSGRIVDLLNVHFHDPDNVAGRAAGVLANFQTLQAELVGSRTFVCAPPEADCATSEGRTGAFNSLCSSGSAISLCPTYFEVSCAEQARQLIHEVMHSVIGSCRDYAYVHQPGYTALPADQAARNPDSYAQFAKMVFMGALACRDCSSEVQLRPGQYGGQR